VQQNYMVSIGGQQSHQVAGSANVAVAREIVVTAGDQLTLRSGGATIQLRKDGSIVITGVNIQVRGSGDVVVKGARTLTNN
jgi:type VI secretion system secreted protein VgrG